ncbi:hypothetical protein Dimus_014793 [Dionaea muscipula]
MKPSSRANNTQEEEEEYEDDFSAKKEPTPTSKDAKNSDKANAIRSKHSVTEQRRRSKINERFQILRDLVPHGDQKRDTASFLLEVIDYVQLLQEKIQKYEGSYQGWSGDQTKSMQWRHNHWRVQSFLGLPQAIKNGPGPGTGTVFSAKVDDKSVGINPRMPANTQTPVEPDSSHQAYRASDHHPLELVEQTAALPMPFQVAMPTPLQNDLPSRPASDAQTTGYATSSDDQQEHIIEGGTISISSAYSHELLTTLTQALHSSGVDLSRARISIHIDLGKGADNNLLSGSSGSKEDGNPISCDREMTHGTVGSNGEDLEPDDKRLRM